MHKPQPPTSRTRLYPSTPTRTSGGVYPACVGSNRFRREHFGAHCLHTSTLVFPILFRNTAPRERTYRVTLDICSSVKPQYPGSFGHRLFPALHRTRPDTARFQPLSDLDRSKSKCTWTTDAARPHSRRTGHRETCLAHRAPGDSVLQTAPPTTRAHKLHKHRNSTSCNGTRNTKVVSDTSLRSLSTAIPAKLWPHL